MVSRDFCGHDRKCFYLVEDLCSTRTGLPGNPVFAYLHGWIIYRSKRSFVIVGLRGHNQERWEFGTKISRNALGKWFCYANTYQAKGHNITIELSIAINLHIEVGT